MTTDNKTTHTPGPWTLDGWGDEIGITSEKAGALAPVAIIDKSTSYWTDDQCEANARLIAAAPDMLEALKEMAETFSDSCMFRDADGNHASDCISVHVNALINRIEGQDA